MTQQLGQVRQELQSGVASTGQLATDAQRDVAQRLQSSTDALLQMSQKIGEVHQTSQDLSKATQTLAIRAGRGEDARHAGRGDARTVAGRCPSAGRLRHAISLRLHGRHCGRHRAQWRAHSLASIPNFRWRHIAGSWNSATMHGAIFRWRSASTPIPSRKNTSCPSEHTFDYALMFVPSEGVYYELLMTQDSKYGRLDEYCREKRVFPVSPNTFYACLSAVAISLQGQKIEENARHLLAGMAGLKKQFESFADVYEKLGTHLRHAQQCYEEADSRLTRARNSLEQMSQGALPAAEAQSPGTQRQLNRSCPSHRSSS